MRVIGFCFLLMFTIACNQQISDEQQVQTMIEDILQAVSNDDYEAYEAVIATEEELFDNALKVGYDGNRPSEDDINDQIITPWKKEKKKAFNNYKNQDIDWKEVAIDSIQLKTKKRSELETGTIQVFFQHNNMNCKMKFQGLLRNKKGKIKVTSSPWFQGCK